MQGSDIVVKCLEKEGVNVVFGYPGATICPFYDSIEDTDIRTVLVRTEQNAAHMASGYARINGRPGVCAVTSGPGATNLITGIATAFADSIPLICITGQVNSNMIGSDMFQEADITGAVESFVKYSYLVRNVNDIPRIFKEAFYIASTGRKGPVLIDIPFDIQMENVKSFSYPEKISMRTYKPTVEGNMAQIAKVIKEIEKAKKPLICVGGGVHLSGAVNDLRSFAKRFQIPVVTTMMGIGVMKDSDPLFYGMVGNNGRPYANKAMNDSDFMMLIGARVADRAVNRPDLIMEDKVLIHIDVDPAEIGKNVGSTIPLVGDIKHILNQIESVSPEEMKHDKWLSTLNEYKNSFCEKRSDPKKGQGFVNPETAIRTLSDMMDDNAVFVADVGQNQMWATAYYNIKDDGRFLTSGGMGTMGYAIPAAIGAKMAAPDRQVVASCGDGSFQMSMMELATLVQQNVPIKIVVFRNNYLGMVREYEHYSLNDRYALVDIKGKPDLDKLAMAYGIGYIRVDEETDMQKAYKDFLEKDKAVLMEIIVDPLELAKI